ncbi:MAG: hypothetical protein GF329_17000 [Candidatus Lokiarchaeota archaeon]|nr:hypothetical protein [Candidatus Lokiarchaeota archaeon]
MGIITEINENDYKFFEILKQTDDEIKIEIKIKIKAKKIFYYLIFSLVLIPTFAVIIYFAIIITEPDPMSIDTNLLLLITFLVMLVFVCPFLGLGIYFLTSKKFITINKNENYLKTRTIHGFIEKNKTYDLHNIKTIHLNDIIRRGGTYYQIELYFKTKKRKKVICYAKNEEVIIIAKLLRNFIGEFFDPEMIGTGFKF